MQSGRILPTFRSFLANSTSARATERDAHSKKDQHESPKRQPKKEEALEAIELISQQEFFQRNGLKAELIQVDSIFVISIKDSGGTPIRSIRGEEILRLLEECRQSAAKAHLGSILDRRI